eukprot:734649-Alexandrium_andersonii.AAC.1
MRCTDGDYKRRPRHSSAKKGTRATWRNSAARKPQFRIAAAAFRMERRYDSGCHILKLSLEPLLSSFTSDL